ncbi:MAG: hypothetical protein ONB32_15325 [candidate division KSB1 bacterium]|nr:hypothetical protein [candidate division KSB1 bacterium]MDZ7401827.1 hypothetical protein [candidate division KSB1 bacterium]
MNKFNTQDFEWIEYLPPSSIILKQKIKNILRTTEKCTIDEINLDLVTGHYQITLYGKLKDQRTCCQN